MATINLLQSILSSDLVSKKYIMDIDSINPLPTFMTEDTRSKYAELAAQMNASTLALAEEFFKDILIDNPIDDLRSAILAFAAAHPYISIQDILDIFNEVLDSTNMSEYEKDLILQETFGNPETQDYTELFDELKKVKGIYDNYAKNIFDSTPINSSNVSIVAPLENYNEIQLARLAEYPSPFDWSKTTQISLGELFGLGQSMLNPIDLNVAQADILDKLSQSVQKSIVVLQNFLYQSLGKNENKIAEYEQILAKYTTDSQIEIETNMKKYDDEMLRYENEARIAQETQVNLYNKRIDELEAIVPRPAEEIAILENQRDEYIARTDAEITLRLNELLAQKTGYYAQATSTRNSLIIKLTSTLNSYKHYIQYDVIQAQAGIFSFAQVLLVLLNIILAVYNLFTSVMQMVQTFYPYYVLIVRVINIWKNPAEIQRLAADLSFMGLSALSGMMAEVITAIKEMILGTKVELNEQLLNDLRAMSGLINAV